MYRHFQRIITLLPALLFCPGLTAIAAEQTEQVAQNSILEEYILSSEPPVEDDTENGRVGSRQRTLEEISIVQLPEGGTLIHMRQIPTSPAQGAGNNFYTISVVDAALSTVLDRLVSSYPQVNYGDSVRDNETTLVILDDLAYERLVTLSFPDLTLEALIDRISIASGCNIYLEGRTVTVDLCN